MESQYKIKEWLLNSRLTIGIGGSIIFTVSTVTILSYLFAHVSYISSLNTYVGSDVPMAFDTACMFWIAGFLFITISLTKKIWQ